ncbi:MAG: hypothetical protein ABJB01_03820 [Rudaea sp.]
MKRLAHSHVSTTKSAAINSGFGSIAELEMAGMEMHVSVISNRVLRDSTLRIRVAS